MPISAPVRSLLILLTISFATEIAAADDSVDYLKQVKPPLLHKCSSCHGGLRQKSELRVDTIALLKKGGGQSRCRAG